MTKSVLIIGEDPEQIDFDAPGAPEGMTAEKVMAGLNASADRLRAAGHGATLLLTKGADSIEAQTTKALAERQYAVIVIGAGLRTLPPMAEQFERLMNVLHSQAPDAKFAFNNQPDDSDKAAIRWL